MEMSDRILIGLAAAGDAICLPDRQPLQFRRHAVIAERRRQFHSAGLVWNSAMAGVAGDADKMAASRALIGLEASKLVMVSRRGQTRTELLRLTNRADELIRHSAGLPSWSDAKIQMDYLRVLGDLPAGIDGTGTVYTSRGSEVVDLIWICEQIFGGIPPKPNGPDAEDRKILGQIEITFLPAIARGHVVSGSSARGHVSYALTGSGLQFLARHPVGDANYGTPPAAPNEFGQFYLERRKIEEQQLASAIPTTTWQVGELLLPLSPAAFRPGREEFLAQHFATSEA